MTRLQKQAKLEKKAQWMERMLWVQVVVVAALGVYCIGVLKL